MDGRSSLASDTSLLTVQDEARRKARSSASRVLRRSRYSIIPKGHNAFNAFFLAESDEAKKEAIDQVEYARQLADAQLGDPRRALFDLMTGGRRIPPFHGLSEPLKDSIRQQNFSKFSPVLPPVQALEDLELPNFSASDALPTFTGRSGFCRSRDWTDPQGRPSPEGNGEECSLATSLLSDTEHDTVDDESSDFDDQGCESEIVFASACVIQRPRTPVRIIHIEHSSNSTPTRGRSFER
ncbi:hypothetical protein GQ53DRAFT_846521 [Thozetella sp. PMI_491]|nr:hypothetical protein GQ53DRAFT_846521 [Thozetella sp. PMI_491]